MCIDGIGAVISLTQSRGQECIARERIGLARLVCHLAGGVVNVDEGSIEIRKAHGHCGAGEMSGTVLHPPRGPEIIADVEPYVILQLSLRSGHPIAPYDTVVPFRDRS